MWCPESSISGQTRYLTKSTEEYVRAAPRDEKTHPTNTILSDNGRISNTDTWERRRRKTTTSRVYQREQTIEEGSWARVWTNVLSAA